MPRTRHLALLFMITVAFVILSGCSDSSSPPPPPSISETVTLQVFDEAFRPVATSAEWAAFQDGDRSWAVLEPSATGVYTATVTDAHGRFGFALVADGDLHLQFGTVEEAAGLVCYLDTGLALAANRRADALAYHGVHGSISYDFAPGESMVSMDRSRSSSSPIASYWFTVPDGLHDLAISDNSWGSSRQVNWLYLERGLDVQGDVTHDVSVASAQRVMLEDGASLQVTGDAAGARVSIGLLTANGTFAMLASYDGITDGAAPFRSVPGAALVSGDRYEARLSSGQLQKTQCFATATGMTMSAPTGSFTTFAIGAVDQGGARLPVFNGLSMPDGRGYFMYCGANPYFIDAIVSSGWLAANDATSCQVPDLAGLAGWQSAWSIPAGTVINDYDAGFFDGNVSLARCVRHHFSLPTSPLAAREWVSTTWFD